jgi:hypothetical protein
VRRGKSKNGGMEDMEHYLDLPRQTNRSQPSPHFWRSWKKPSISSIRPFVGNLKKKELKENKIDLKK